MNLKLKKHMIYILSVLAGLMSLFILASVILFIWAATNLKEFEFYPARLYVKDGAVRFTVTEIVNFHDGRDFSLFAATYNRPMLRVKFADMSS